MPRRSPRTFLEPFGEADPVFSSRAEAEAERLAAFLGAAPAVGGHDWPYWTAALAPMKRP